MVSLVCSSLEKVPEHPLGLSQSSDPSEYGRKMDVALRDVGQWAILVMGWWLGWMILEMFSNLNDATIQ